MIHFDEKTRVRAEGLSKTYGSSKNYRTSLQNRILGRSAHERFERIWAVDDLNLDIMKGEVLGVVGSNGAGKSTLVRLLSRLTLPTKGRAVIEGKVASVLEVGSGFHPDLSVKENAVLNAVLLGARRKDAEEKLDEILEFSQLRNRKDNQLKTLSTGMQYRLAVSVALKSDADFLLLDEVLEVTDQEFEARCFDLIRNEQMKKTSYLFVSHNLSQIGRIANRILWMKAGKEHLLGETETVLAAYTEAVK